MIKAIITDVDGVIVGKKQGVNFPLPSELVIRKLKELQTKGIPVVLNTAKFSQAVTEIIKSAGLRNPHITDGGALIIDPLDDKIIKTHFINQKLAKEIVVNCLKHNIYVEGVGVEDYYLQKNQVNEFTKTRISILQKEHKPVASLADHLDEYDVIKIVAFVKSDKEKSIVEEELNSYKNEIHYIWSTHPAMYPIQAAVITANGVSKKHASVEVLEYLNITPEETLGVGDTLGDWHFMDVCGYAGVTGNHSQQLIENAKGKGEGKYFIASDADHDGFLELVDNFFPALK